MRVHSHEVDYTSSVSDSVPASDADTLTPVEKIDPRYFEHFGTPNEVKSRVAVDA